MKQIRQAVIVAVMVFMGCHSAWASMKIEQGSMVKLAYFFEADKMPMVSEQKKEMMELVEGRGTYPASFEKQLLGLKKGDKKTINLSSEEAYGPVRPELLKRIALDQLPPNLKLQEGQMLKSKSGTTIRVAKIMDDSVVLDENHPLAGKELSYHIQILDVQ